MKKVFGIVVCLLLVACLFAAVPAFAEGAQSSADDVIYFLNPRAIAVVGDKLFVADNIEQGTSVLLCFDVSEKPVYRFTAEVKGDVVNLSAKENGLFVVLTDKVVEYSVEENGITVKQTFNVQGAVDFTYGVNSTDEVLGEYYATSTLIYVKDPRKTSPDQQGYFLPTGFTQQTDVRGIVAEGNYIYCLFRSGDNFLCQRIDGEVRMPCDFETDPLNKNNSLLSAFDEPLGIFAWQDDKHPVGIFFEDSIFFVEIADVNSTFNPLIKAKSAEATGYDVAEKGEIVDVEAHNDDLIVLNGRNKVEIFTKDGATGAYSSAAVIGTETVSHAVPTIDQLKSYTLVKSEGYPTNIVFQTTGGNSVENLIKDASEYIVLGYDGDENFPFYYVLIGDKFGWVKKCDDAEPTLSQQKEDPNDKLEVLKRKHGEDLFVGNEFLQYKTQFNSLNAVWVYPLPREAFRQDTPFTQSATNRADVVALQRFPEETASGIVWWYYVRYDGDKLGFVKEETIGKFHLESVVDITEMDVVGDCKVNGALFGFVQLYDNNNPETMDENHFACDAEMNELDHLSPGTRVTLIKEYDNGTALVQVVHKDGSQAFGYCYSDQLIGVGALTTNAIFGIVTVSVAVVLAVTLTVVFLKRKKKKKAAETTDEQ